MKSTLRVTLLALLGATLSFSGNTQVFKGKQADELVKNAALVRVSKNHEVPNYVQFQKGHEVAFSNYFTWLNRTFPMHPSLGFQFMRADKDQLGQVHYRYQQTFNGVPIEGAVYIVHTEGGMVHSMNGELFTTPHFAGTESFGKSNALEAAKTHTKCDVFSWEIPAEEQRLKVESGNPNATYYPAGDLVYVAPQGDFFGGSFRLAYKFDIYAISPVWHSEVYVDAASGKVLFENRRIYGVDTPGTANTAYNGTQNIIADSFGGGFRLRESGRGNGVRTYDMQNGTSYGAAVDFTDADNNWTQTGLDQYALDAHWGAEMTYDYFDIEHNRNSIDDNGFALLSYVHYDNNYANAFWDGQRMTYGDGNGSLNPLTALDIAGHEITHGLTTFTANLVYQNESGALNESFSDIFGTAVEFFAGTSPNWSVGEDIGTTLRSMQAPNLYGDPDTYLGTNWYTGTADNGGVHTNSGVQNRWFYVLSQGATGNNDFGQPYSVTGIGITSAGEIAYRNLVFYMTQNSTYTDAQFYGILSATDLFGACSPEVIATTNAWYSVGLGSEYDPTFTTDFSPSTTGGCTLPLQVDFSAISASQGTGTYTWDFGDGNTGNGSNPSHTYLANGNYTVTLIEDGGPCGIDTAIQIDIINVGQLADPMVVNAASCTSPAVLTLGASGTGNLTWWDAPTGGNQIATGGSYTTPSISSTTSYWVESEIGSSPDYVGPADHTFSTGGYFTGNQSLVFDAYTDFTLVSVWVDANGAGNRTIELRDDQGGLVQSTTVNIPNGQSTVTLNFNVPAGTDYTLTSPSPDLYRNNAGAAYPYTLPGVCSITGSTAGAAGYYYFFYDWEVQTTPCQSQRVEVLAGIAAPPLGVEDSICGPGQVTISGNGTGTGTLHWYDAPTGGNYLGSGPTYTTPVISSSTTYYVEEEIPGPLSNAGPVDNTFGGGGYFNGDQHLVFDVFQAVTLESVYVYAQSAGLRTIELRDNTGTVVQDTMINIPAGGSRITLNFDLQVGTDWELGTLQGSNPDLFRNNSGPSYPYTLPGILSITESSAGTPGYYYFFYDWEVREAPCFTTRTAVTAEINAIQDATITTPGVFCPTDPSVNLTAVDNGGTWSGTGITDVNLGTFDPGTAGAGNHQVIYTIGGFCGDADTVTVPVNAAFDATITPVGPYCEEDIATNLTAVDPGGNWTGTGITDAVNGTFDPLTAGPGTHTITYTITGACGDSQTEDIVVMAQDDATIDPVAGGPYCEVDSAFNLTNSGTMGGNWSGFGVIDNVNGTFDPQVAGPGNHLVSYATSGTCPDAETITITIGLMPDASITPVPPQCEEGGFVPLISATGGGTYTGPGMTGNLFYPDSAGVGIHTIHYVVSPGNGCTAEDSIQIEVVSCLGIAENKPNLVSIFPNPNNGQFQIKVQGQSTHEAVLTILDASGKLVHNHRIPARPGLITVTPPRLSTGLYMVQLNSNGKVETAKVIVR